MSRLWMAVWIAVGGTTLGASMNEQALQQRSLPGYVLRGRLWQDSTQTTFTTSWSTPALPDSVVLTLLLPSCQIEGAMDSVVVVYRPPRGKKSGG